MRIVLSFILVILCATSGFAERTFHLSTDANFPPYSELVNGEVQGIDVDIIHEAASRAGLKIVIHAYPWKRTMMMLANGETDGVFAAFRNEKRETYAIFSNNPVHVSNLAVFTNRSSHNNYNELEDLFGQTVFIAAGFSISNEFDAAVVSDKIRPSYARDTEDGLDRLLSSPNGFLISNRVSVLYFARKKGVRDAIRSNPILLKANRGAYLAIPRTGDADPELQKMLEKLDRAIGLMWEDGTIEAIIDSYISTPPSSP